MITIVIPVLNEAKWIEKTLKSLQKFRENESEIIVVDGGSTDTTVLLARPLADHVLTAEADWHKGRGIQMDRGARLAKGGMLLFLHCDTVLPVAALAVLSRKVQQQEMYWGRFDVRLSSPKPIFRVIEFCINLRSRYSGIATGDQAIFVDHGLYHDVQGFKPIPLMEDIDLSRRLKQRVRPECLKMKVVTSSRRWEINGAIRTVVKMWLLRFGYWIGIPPKILVNFYR